MAKFKPGDKVRCIKNIFGIGELKIDEIYTIVKEEHKPDHSHNYSFFSIVELNYNFPGINFELVKEKKVPKPRGKKETAPKDSGWGF